MEQKKIFNLVIFQNSTMDFMLNNWAGIVASLAMIGTIVSSFFAYRTFQLQRIHNIKSVKPILHIGQWDYEQNIRVDLRNQGSGIGIIKNIDVYKNPNEIKTCIFHWLPDKLPGTMNYKEYWTLHKDIAIKAGDIFTLIELPINVHLEEHVEQREKIRSILGQLTVEVEYEDIYGNPMDKLVKKLYLFLRTDNENSHGN